MNTGPRGFTGIGVLLVLLVTLVMGTLGGGVAGGALTYYFVQQLAPTAAPIVSTTTAPPATVQPQAAPRAQMVLTQGTAIVDTVKKVTPAIVTIVSTIQSTRGTRTRQAQALGTGIIIDAKGYIVTNNHVIAGAQQIEVLFVDGAKVPANLVGADPANDLAVIQVTGKAMPALAELGDSTVLQLGEPVIAIGDALGDYQNTVTVGVVSALNRTVDTGRRSSLKGLIQTDAALNHGDSGGPLLNVEGQVVGINTLVMRSDPAGDVAQGLGFAIPSSTVKQVSAQLIAKGK